MILTATGFLIKDGCLRMGVVSWKMSKAVRSGRKLGVLLYLGIKEIRNGLWLRMGVQVVGVDRSWFNGRSWAKLGAERKFRGNVHGQQ
ncbi:unnamed protein product [Sphenostylis stenocarpa]|uniref:Uncharacterized protein n=1 Tax=Sphenostylis stenocarpa TaxID=92480 RepID=A0AA86VTP9_9FABA|nr:unnamed protein product [Sphenostylis stenocarpa]